MKSDLKTRHGGRILADALVAQGAKLAFGVPGESYLPVLDGLHDVREQLAFIVCRQEGGASYMAEACGKLTGEPGVDRKSTRMNSSHTVISYAVFCLKKKNTYARNWPNALIREWLDISVTLQ